MDLKDLKSLVKLMHKENIVSYKTPELELLIQPRAPKPLRKRNKVEPDSSLMYDFKGKTEEEILFWSSPNPES